MSEQDKGFESLASYQHSLRLLKASYKLAQSLPAHEKYNLADQIRRTSAQRLVEILLKGMGVFIIWIGCAFSILPEDL